MTIYSVRTSLGRELWWTTGRKRALIVVEQLNRGGLGTFVHPDGRIGGYSATQGLTDMDLPVSVYLCREIKARAEVPT